MEPQEVIADRIMEALLPGGRASSSSTVNVHHHDGKGTWIAVTACLVMLAVVIVGALWATREFSRYDAQLVEAREEIKTTQTYLNAIYQIAPQLKPKEKKE